MERGVPQAGISALDDEGDPGLDERFAVASDVISEAEQVRSRKHMQCGLLGL